MKSLHVIQGAELGRVLKKRVFQASIIQEVGTEMQSKKQGGVLNE